MKSLQRSIVLIALLLLPSAVLQAESTINPDHRFAWAANAGWIDFRPSAEHGAVFGRTIMSGFLYGANIGWISLGDGTPAQGAHYANDSAADFGVNVDYNSDPNFALLSGFAYSANAGWISFNVAGEHAPRIDKATGTLKGYAYSANLGWIPLEQQAIRVETALPQVVGSVIARLLGLEQPNAMNGDANGDAAVDAADVQELLNQ